MKAFVGWLQRLFRTTQPDPPTRAAPSASPAYKPSPEVKPAKAPVHARGTEWLNTSEDGWQLPPRDEPPLSSNVEQLVKGMGAGNRAETRRASAESLGQLGCEAVPVMPALLCATTDIDAGVRQAALQALDAIDPDWPARPAMQSAIPDLLKALDHWSQEVGRAAFHTVSLFGAHAVPVLNDILLAEEDTVGKIHAVRLLCQLGPDASGAVPGLIKALKSQFLPTRIAAAEALGQLGACAEQAIPALISNLHDSYAEARQAAATCLSQMGAAAEPAMPALVPLLADRQPEVRKAVVSALKGLGPKIVPAMIEVVRAQDVERMKRGIEARTRILSPSHVSPAFVADFQQVLDNLSWAAYDVLSAEASLIAARESAIGILAELEAVSDAIVPAIAGALRDPSPRLRLAAIRALGKIGPAAAAAAPDLRLAALDPDPAIQAAAMDALVQLEVGAASR